MLIVSNRNFIGILISVLVIGLFESCDQPPELPLEPKITFNSIRYSPGNNLSDSLILKIDFEDGDGDLGIDYNETDPKFQEFFFVRKSGGLMPSFIENEIIRYGTPNQPDFDTKNWFVADFDGDSVVDTVRIEYNENFYNIFLDFFYRADTNNDGDISDDTDYIRIDFEEIFGFTLNSRFFPLNTADNERPLKGTLTFKMVQSFRLNPIIRDNILKIDVQIQDRAFNKSNIVSTNDFQLQ